MYCSGGACGNWVCVKSIVAIYDNGNLKESLLPVLMIFIFFHPLTCKHIHERYIHDY